MRQRRIYAGEAARIRAYVAELQTLSPDILVANSTPVIAALRQATGPDCEAGNEKYRPGKTTIGNAPELWGTTTRGQVQK